MVASFDEFDAGAGDEISHRARDEHLAGLSNRADPRAGRNGDTCDLFSDDLALPRVDASANGEVELVGTVDDSSSAADCTGRTVEATEESVSISTPP